MYKLLPILLFAYSLAVTTDDIYDNSYALVIGIDKYKNVPLDYAVKDAESVATLLYEKFNFPSKNIKTLLNEEATLSNIKNSLAEISSSAKENDRVLIYFAGHGVTDDLPDGGEMGYLLPIDGKKDNLFSTSIPMDDLRRISSMSQSKHMLFLIDACYGGLAVTGARGLSSSTPNYIDKITKDKSRQIITAGGKGEQVIEKSEWGHSAFTINLIRALEDGKADLNDDGYITADELGLFLKEKVSIDSDNMQTPQSRRFTSQEGEFVFISKTDNVTLNNNEKVIINEAEINYDILAKKLAKEMKQTNNSIPKKNVITKVLIHITSLAEHTNEFEGKEFYESLLGRKLIPLSSNKLDVIRKNLEGKLLGEYMEEPYEMIIKYSPEDVDYLNKYSLLDFNDESFSNVSINYKRFRFDNIHYINVYQIQDELDSAIPIYFFREMKWFNLPYIGSNGSNYDSNFIDIEKRIFQLIDHRYSGSGKVGIVSSIEDDIVYIKLTNLKIKKRMKLQGSSLYKFALDGRQNRIDDLTNGIKYLSSNNDSISSVIIEMYKDEIKSINEKTGFNASHRVFTMGFSYKLMVIDLLADSIAVTKVTDLTYPYVTIRAGDEVWVYK